jgi:CRP-like cAMP-binding protein
MGTTMEDASKLRSISLFAGLSDRELEDIAGIVRRVSHPKGALVFAEGDPGDALYLVEEGKVRISKVLSGIGEEALAIFGPGSVFGEMAVLDGGRRSADAIVQEDARLLVLERERFHALLRDDKDLAYQVLSVIVQTLAGRVREMNDKVFAFYVLAAFT